VKSKDGQAQRRKRGGKKQKTKKKRGVLVLGFGSFGGSEGRLKGEADREKKKGRRHQGKTSILRGVEKEIPDLNFLFLGQALGKETTADRN